MDFTERAVAAVPLRPVALGVVGALALLASYLGTLALVQDWSHAFEQLGTDLWFVGAIAAGFGVQVGLFTHLRTLRAQHRAAALAGAGMGVATSTGTSLTAMLACCAHHLSDLAPLAGVAGATALLEAYKLPLMWLSLAMSVAGIAYMLWQLRKMQEYVGGGQSAGLPYMNLKRREGPR